MASVVWIHEFFLSDSSMYKYAEHFYISSIFKIKLFLVFIMHFMIANQRVKLCYLCNKKINTKGTVFSLKKEKKRVKEKVASNQWAIWAASERYLCHQMNGLCHFRISNQNLPANCAIYYTYLTSRIVYMARARKHHVMFAKRKKKQRTNI